MKGERLEVTRGSGNVFRDLEHENANLQQLKAILAAAIIKALDGDGLSVRAAHSRTGIVAADFSRIRNAKLGRFTVDHQPARITVEVKVRQISFCERRSRRCVWRRGDGLAGNGAGH